MGLADKIAAARHKQRDAELAEREFLAVEAAAARVALPALRRHLVDARDALVQAGVALDEEREHRYTDWGKLISHVWPAGWPLGSVGRFDGGLWLRADGGLAASVRDMARYTTTASYHVPYDLKDEDIVELWTFHGRHAESRGFYVCGGLESWSCRTLDSLVNSMVMKRLGLQ